MLNSVFLYHAVKAGLDLAIINPAHIRPYAEIPPEQREVAEALIFNRAPEALARYIAFFEGVAPDADAGDAADGRRAASCPSTPGSTTASCTARRKGVEALDRAPPWPGAVADEAGQHDAASTCSTASCCRR